LVGTAGVVLQGGLYPLNLISAYLHLQGVSAQTNQKDGLIFVVMRVVIKVVMRFVGFKIISRLMIRRMCALRWRWSGTRAKEP